MIVSFLENVAFKARGGGGEKKKGETTNVLATQKLNGVLWDNQSIVSKGYKSTYVCAERKPWALHHKSKRGHFVVSVQV